MKLSQVIEGIQIIQAKGPQGKGDSDLEVEVTGVCHDSRLFKTGDLFIAVRGHQFDGHMFIPQACEQGAPAVLVEDDRVVPMKYQGVVVKVKDTRKCVASVAAHFFEKPSDHLFVIGVTGTNGKTTVTHMIEAVLNHAAIPTAVIGTIGSHLGDKSIQVEHTTPDALDVQKLLAHWQKEGAQAVSMEVSSHALALSRVDSVQFDVAVFTNLTRDHLDFHASMDDYVGAKSLLFKQLLKRSKKPNRLGILNFDDAYHESVREDAVPNWTFGLNGGDIKAENLKMTFHGTRFQVTCPAGSVDVELAMIGRHNVSNALAAFAVGLHKGIELPKIAKALASVRSVRGRLERVSGNSPVHVFVDYAHTDDALKNVLSFLKSIRDETSTKSRIITVFGCGGDRDKGKRPLMMQVVQSFSDIVFVTSDNPRTEDPRKIIDDILHGANPSELAEGNTIFVEADRREAIRLALEKSLPGDVVLIAGKGHEDYQIIGTKRFPFDDAKIAKEFLRK